MVKFIQHNKDIEQIYMTVVVSIPPWFTILKDDKKSIKVGKGSSTATIRLEIDQISISGATSVVKDCYAAIKENVDNLMNQSQIGKRKIMGTRKCDGPTCTCGLCDGFFK